MRTTVCHGSGPVTATAYMNYGMLLGSQGKMEQGIKFGQLALRYLDRPQASGSPIAPRFAYYFAMSHWNSHLRESLAPILEIHQQARDQGDAFYTAYTLGYYSVHALLGNRDLAEIETVLAEYEPVVKSAGVDAAYHFMQLYRQTAANLAVETEDPCRLMGEYYNEVEMLAVDTEADNRGRDQGLYGNKLLLGLIFGQYEQVLEHSKTVQAIMATGPSMSAMAAAFYYWDALVHLACYPTAASGERAELVKHADAQRKQLGIWARQAPVNYAQKYARRGNRQ